MEMTLVRRSDGEIAVFGKREAIRMMLEKGVVKPPPAVVELDEFPSLEELCISFLAK